MKILALGNSFSQDATAYLKKFADSASIELKVVNLYIGGCSLATHIENIKGNRPLYKYELNGVDTGRLVSVCDVIKEDDWDIVTMQQVSHLSGKRETFGKDAEFVADFLKKNAPNAKLWFHQTWAYEVDSTHPGFAIYDNSQEKMYEMSISAMNGFAEQYGIPIIQCGEVINALRKTAYFDYKNGGESLCRDGFHMSAAYGRFTVAAVWFKTLLNGNLSDVSFVPAAGEVSIDTKVSDNFVIDMEKIKLIKDTVNAIA